MTMSNVKIEKLLFRQSSACGRAISTYEITTGEGTSRKTRVMTITWVEKSRKSDLAKIRNFIKEKRPRGLAPLSAVFRTKHRTLPAFLPRDKSFKGIVPRAEEFVVHEKFYKPLATLNNTKELARALEGAIEGHRQLWDYGFIHRDVSYGNVMVDQHGDGALIEYNLAVKKAQSTEEERRFDRSGTLPYLSRLLLIPNPNSVVHERWHDIESFFYVASHTFLQSGSTDPPVFEKSDAAYIFDSWSAQYPKDATVHKGYLMTAMGFQRLRRECASRWYDVKDVLSIFKDNCSLLVDYAAILGTTEEFEVELFKAWDTNVMSYEIIQTRLRALC